MIEIIEESNLQYKGYLLQYGEYGIIVRDSSGQRIGEFASDTEAYEYIDDIDHDANVSEDVPTTPKKDPSKYRYLIYATDEPYENNRALFYRRSGSAKFSYEADADDFSYEKMLSVTSSTNGKHRWKGIKIHKN